MHFYETGGMCRRWGGVSSSPVLQENQPICAVKAEADALWEFRRYHNC